MLFVSYQILVVALFLLALVFLFLPIQKNEYLSNYITSLKFIAISYIALGIYCIFKWRIEIQLINIYFLLISHIQANLLGISHINLLNPQIVDRRFVFRHFIPMLICLGIYIFIRIFNEPIALNSYSIFIENATNIEVVVRIFWFIIYLATIIYYALQFVRNYKLYRFKALNFFSEEKKLDLSIVHNSCFLALLVASVSILITTNLNSFTCTILNFIMLTLYVIMGIFYIQYPKIFFNISKVVSNDDNEQSVNIKKYDWQKIKQRIIDNKIYLRNGITLENIALELGINRNALSSMINNYEQINYNTFINTLRIEEAKRIMKENINLKIAEISELAGFSEQSNFSKQFKLITGISPIQYKKSLEKL